MRWRMTYRPWRASSTPQTVIILGTNGAAKHLAAVLVRTHTASYLVKGFVEEGTVTPPCGAVRHPMILRTLEELPQIIGTHQPDMLVVALLGKCTPLTWRVLLGTQAQGVRIEDDRTLYEKLTKRVLVHPEYTHGFPLCRRHPWREAAKRLTDMLLSAVSLCVVLPCMALIALFIKLDSRGPVFFHQDRVGKDGRTFTLTKFRTMVPDAEKHSGPVWAQEDDPRITRMGHLLRRTGFDELPQLWSIFKGDMSLVGPRPERPYFVAQLTEQLPGYAQRLSVRPGLTGWAQVSYGYGASVEDAQTKLGFDLYYIKHRSFWLDLWIMLCTVPKVLGAHVTLRASAPTSTLTLDTLTLDMPQTGGTLYH